jgi:transcriptional regulator with XRE-family HTH domain
LLVARLRAQNLSLRKIAENVGVSVATVSKDLQKAREYYQEQAGKHYEEHVAQTLASIDALTAAAYKAFHESVGKKVVTTETRGAAGKRTVSTRTTVSPGEPKFLSIIAGLIEQRIRLLGSMKGEQAGGRTLSEWLAEARNGRDVNATFTRETVSLDMYQPKED